MKREAVTKALDELCSTIARNPEIFVRDGSEISDGLRAEFPLAVVPLVFQERFIGALEVVDDNTSRTWQENEILLLRTVANQVSVAINHADLFAQMQQQALTDSSQAATTAVRSEMQLRSELQMARAWHQPLRS